MKPYLLERHESGYLLFTINREERRNAINYEVMEGLESAISAALDKHVKALVITGAGDKAFCSGGDLSVFHELRTESEAYQMLSKMANILYKLAILPKPTVALLNGTAVGGGCEIATACDYRVARTGVKAGFIQGKLAITTGWGGGTLLAEKLLPHNVMKLLMEADKYSVDQLQDMGFIHAVYEEQPTVAIRDFLTKTLELDGEVLQAYKSILISKWKNSHLKERMNEEVRKCAILWEREEHHRQVEIFVNKK
ncbi:enoyl-CoA hydratase/isomerase family protein [Cytobacillus spongiae]|uniref:enoyl-CoA hydratase/isomerase family protein n=1 Tax=Cytobacillus spongiae TaxID=2901381 RepID=UPI001F445994|nr:enoyl-CoA hydratase/isomerase family protein [Cytobacillus spongiae]UII57301.1 enoyl-CoA hydratase/isomerase family protein [Cytobacillus spongiae]